IELHHPTASNWATVDFEVPIPPRIESERTEYTAQPSWRSPRGSRSRQCLLGHRGQHLITQLGAEVSTRSDERDQPIRSSAKSASGTIEEIPRSTNTAAVADSASTCAS